MTPTNEQIMEEAYRRYRTENDAHDYKPVEHFIIEVMRENWTPPEPVDPDLLAFREWAAEIWPVSRSRIEKGVWDQGTEASAYLAGARMAAERERERAEVLVEYVEIHTRRLDGVGGRAVAALAKYRGERDD